MADLYRRLGLYRSYSLREVGIILLGFTSQVVISACGSVAVDQADPARPTLSSEVDDDDDQLIEPAEVTTDKALWFEATPVFCCNPLSLDFVVDLTEAPAGVSAPFDWDFDDGRTATGAAVQHTFAVPGDYLVTVTATVPGGSAVKAERIISLTGQSTDDPETPDGSIGDSVDGTDDVLDPDGLDPIDPEPDEDATPPVADAGADQAVAPGDIVRLDGNGSFIEPQEPLVFLWSQSAGPMVALSNRASVTATFAAPPADESPVTLVFELRVAAGGLLDLDTVTITVLPPSDDPDVEFPPGVRVAFLSGPSGLSEPGRVAVSWMFVGGAEVSSVSLAQDCCRCTDVISGIMAPDANGVYHGWVTVPDDGEMWYHVRYRLGGVDYRSQSVHVNPPTGNPSATPAPVIWYQHCERDPTILNEIVRSGVVTHVVIAGADRVVHGFDDPTVLQSINICRAAGLKVIWSRHLWNNWEDFQTLEDTFDPDFYASAVAQVNDEAASLGVDFAALDCEVYGQAPLDEYFNEDLPVENFEAMQAAILQAAALGQVDFVYPCGSTRRPLHHNNLYRDLGRNPVSQGTYYDAPEKICTIDYAYKIFAAYVRPTTERPEKGFFPYFLPYDIVQRRHLWSQADGAPGVANGLWLYPGATEEFEVSARQTAIMLADYLVGP